MKDLKYPWSLLAEWLLTNQVSNTRMGCYACTSLVKRVILREQAKSKAKANIDCMSATDYKV